MTYLKWSAFLFLLMACSSPHKTSMAPVSQPLNPSQEIFYHLFQRSFYDSNGDGHGDLTGVVEKLDYLQTLGITSILMTPLYKSIYYHNYFADDFEGIDPEFGTKKEYAAMIKAIHARHLQFYMDMEIQYVTKNHPWFKQSFENPASPYSDYIIYNGPNNTQPESIIFNVSELESYTGEKLGITTVDMYSDKVKEYFFQLFKSWVDPNNDGNFEDGVDGFRIDHMMDDLDWKGIRKNLLADFWGPLIKRLKAINPHLKIIGEQAEWGDLGKAYFAKSDVDMMFAFRVRNGIINFNKKEIIRETDSTNLVTPAGKYQLLFVENHDIDRYASVVKSDPAKLRFGGAFILLSKGVPLIYYGQELGMTGVGGFGKYGNSDGNDIPRRQAFEWYKTVEGKGMALWYKNTGPWWNDSTLKSNDGISYEEEVGDPNSLLSFYTDLIALRKSEPALNMGEEKWMPVENENMLAFCRWKDGTAFLVVFNTSDKNGAGNISGAELPLKYIPTNVHFVTGNDNSQNRFSGNEMHIELPPHGFGVWKVSGQ